MEKWIKYKIVKIRITLVEYYFSYLPLIDYGPGIGIILNLKETIIVFETRFGVELILLL